MNFFNDINKIDIEIDKLNNEKEKYEKELNKKAQKIFNKNKKEIDELDIYVEYKNEYEPNSICFDYIEGDVSIYVFVDEGCESRKLLKIIDRYRQIGISYEDEILEERWWSKPYHSLIKESIEITNKILKEG